MSGPEFFQTHMGRSFYDGTMPNLVRELKALNGHLGKLVERPVSVLSEPDIVRHIDTLTTLVDRETAVRLARLVVKLKPASAVMPHLEEFDAAALALAKIILTAFDPSGHACPVCGAVQDCTPDCSNRDARMRGHDD